MNARSASGASPLLLTALLQLLRRLPAALAFAVLLAVCAFLGIIVALGSPQIDLLLLAAIFGPMLLFVPARWVLPLLIVTGFVVVGLGMYYLRIVKLFWVPYMLCMFLILKLPLDALGHHVPAAERRRPIPLFIWLLFAFFALVLISAALNRTPLINILVGGKHFLFVWAITFLTASRAIDETFLRKCWLLILAIAILQLPFTVIQHFMSIDKNWDAVVGTFGGDPNGGGASGMMAIFLAIACGFVVSLLKVRQISPVLGGAVLVSALVSVAMGEVKFFFVLMPMVIAVVLRRDFVRRPAMAFGIMLIGLVALSAVALFYEDEYGGRVAKSRQSETSDYLDYIFRDESNLDFINYQTGEVSRLGAPLVWLHTANKDGLDKLLLGYGLTASRPSETIGQGVMAKRFPFKLNTSTLTILLWDSGLLGLLTFCAVLVTAALRAMKLSSAEPIPPFHRACLDGCVGALVGLMASLPYNGAAIDHVSIQFFLPFVVGYVLFWSNRVAAMRVRA